MNQEEREITLKGHAFTRYFFIDRGAEKDLSLEQALEDFENYIYAPLCTHVAQEMVTKVVEESIDLQIPEGKSVEDLDEADLEKVSQTIGLSFLTAYLDIHGEES